ncbi:MAG: glycosyltransferase [Candidatus Sulfotelmatobacter sp.]
MKDIHPKVPVISVVMPVLNVAPFIKLAVKSVLDQTFKQFEMVVVDDGSTDGTIEALEPLRDDRLRVLKQANSGSAAARNAGLRQTTAPYVAFIDGDDLWEPQMLATHLEFLGCHPEIDLSFSQSSVIDESGATTGRSSRRVSGYISFRELLIENFVHNGSAVVVRREALDKAGWFDVNLRAAVDHDVWLRVAIARVNNVYGIPKVLTFYRMRAGQVTKDWRRMEQSWRVLIEKMRRLAPGEVCAVETRARSNLYRYLAYIAYESGEYSESWRLLAGALAIGFLHLVHDRRMWVLAAALTARVLLPPKAHQKLERFARAYRSRERMPAKGAERMRQVQRTI